MTQDTADQLKRSLVIDSSLLFIYLIATAYLFYFLSTTRPHVGLWQELIIVIPLFGVIRRAFFSIYTLVYKKQASHKFIISVASFVAGVIFSSLLANLSSGFSVDRLTRAYQPMIDALHANQISQCKQPGTELNVIDSIRPKVKNRHDLSEDYWATVYLSGDRFVVAMVGDSFEKGDSTLYYESERKRWKQFHNDIYNDKRIFQKLTKNTVTCKINEFSG